MEQIAKSIDTNLNVNFMDAFKIALFTCLAGFVFSEQIRNLGSIVVNKMPEVVQNLVYLPQHLYINIVSLYLSNPVVVDISHVGTAVFRK